MLFSWDNKIINHERNLKIHKTGSWLTAAALWAGFWEFQSKTTWTFYEFSPLIMGTPWSDIFCLNQLLRLSRCHVCMLASSSTADLINMKLYGVRGNNLLCSCNNGLIYLVLLSLEKQDLFYFMIKSQITCDGGGKNQI